eukprot:768580-Hanusia_phi.AAC.5
MERCSSEKLAVWNSSWPAPDHDYWRAHILDSKFVPLLYLLLEGIGPHTHMLPRLLASARSYSTSASKGHSGVSSRAGEDHNAAAVDPQVEEAESQPSSRLQQPLPPKKELIIFPRRKAGQLKRS